MKKKIYFFVNRYKFFLIFFVVLILVTVFERNTGITAFNIVKNSFLQMLSVLPPIMIHLGLMDARVSRKSMMKYMGNDSGIMGIAIAITFAAFAAGPMYAAFP